jgi:hypothetical protein
MESARRIGKVSEDQALVEAEGTINVSEGRRLSSDESRTASALRHIVLLLFLVGAAAAVVDLLLIGHYEDPWQFAPLVLIAASLASLAWCAASSKRQALRATRATMLCLIAGGIGGIWLHYRANSEFEREMYPALEGLELFWKAIRGASPPSVAPATLIHLGLLGLAWTYRHPMLDTRTTTSGHEGDRR